MKKTIYIKYILYALVNLLPFVLTAQTRCPFYEQLAFNYYQNTILDSFPVKKKITVYKLLLNLHPNSYTYASYCIGGLEQNTKFSILKAYTENQTNFDSLWYELDTNSINKKQFRVNKKSGGRYPRLYISSPFTEKDKEKRIFVNVHEQHSETFSIIYCIEFDWDNKIINWCRTENQIYIEY